jgi:GDSL-like Lipase/Acylhydrolase family
MHKAMSVQPLNLLGRHPRASKHLLLMFSTLLSLTVAEIALRIVQRTPTGHSHHKLFAEYHPVLGWQKKPDFSGIHVGPEEIYRVRETMNSKGIRGPEYPYEKPPQEFRIVVLGDSFAEGYTVEFEDLFSEVLKRRLNRDQRRPVQVINAGTGGYSTDQELLWFTTEGIKYSPNLTVLLFCSNDILFNTMDRYWRGHKPLFRIEGGTLKLTNVPVPPPLPPAQQPVSRPPGVKRWLYNSSYLYRNMRNTFLKSENITRLFVWAGLAQPSRDSTKRHTGPNSDVDDKSPVPDYIRLADWSKSTEEERGAGWTITKALLSKLKADAQAAGSRLLVMIVPENDEVTSGVASIRRENSIDCIDPTAQFRDEELRLKRSGKKLTFAPLDGHWNAAGHRLAAEVLREHIVTHGYLSGQTGVRVDTVDGYPVPNKAIDSDEE